MRPQTSAKGSEAGALDSVVDWQSGELFARWRPTALLGRGGTAEVWHAVAPDGREAALKVPRREHRYDATAHAWLRREHDVLRAVASPYLVRPYELIETDGTVVLALEYLPHGDLVPLLGAPPRRWLSALRTTVAALADLERHGLAHADVKARNVLFAADGSARLGDLASARPLDAPAAATTQAYRLPKRWPGLARYADWFALAVLLFELVTGRLPYGPAGAVGGAEPAAVAAPADSVARRLLSVATAALHGEGRVEGLSYFRDVIESVHVVDD